MKKSLLIRLKALLAIAADKLTAEESTELTSLNQKAVAAKIDTRALGTAIESASDEDEDEDEGMTEAELQETVTKAVKSALSNHRGASTEDIVEKVTAALASKSVTEDKMRSIIADVLKENTKSPSKMEFPLDMHGNIDFPCETRAGNLSVSQKQLLNICLMKVSEDALADKGTKRPTGINDGLNEAILRRTKSANDALITRLQRGAKGLTTGGSTSGAELVYTDLSTELMQRLYLTSELATVLMSREINMPTDPFKLPIKTVRTPFTVGSESPTPASLAAYFQRDNPSLGNITLDAKKMIGIASYSYESNEDSVIAILPMLQQDLGDGAAAAFERAVINGDADGTHQDVDKSYTATDVESMFDGFRKAAIAVGVADWSTNGVSRLNFMGLRGGMGKWGVNPNDLIALVSPSGYSQLQSIDDAFRYDGRGVPGQASVNSGTIASFNGIRVVVSEHIYPANGTAGVDATGKAASTSGNIYDQLMLINLSQWLVGVRRGFTVEVTSDPLVQTNYIVASFRRAFSQKDTASASIPHTVLATKWG